MSLTKADLLKTETGPAWTGDVPGVGVVSVREITGADLEFIKNSPTDVPDQRQLMARIVVAGLCDDEGVPIFQPGEVGKVNNMPFARLKALAEVAQKYSGLTDDDAAELGNSQTTTQNGSGTA